MSQQLYVASFGDKLASQNHFPWFTLMILQKFVVVICVSVSILLETFLRFGYTLSTMVLHVVHIPAVKTFPSSNPG